LKNEIALINHPKIKNKPPRGVINQICLACTRPKEMLKMEPEKNKIPAINNTEIIILDFSDSIPELVMNRMANT